MTGGDGAGVGDGDGVAREPEAAKAAQVDHPAIVSHKPYIKAPYDNENRLRINPGNARSVSYRYRLN
jgi:hypothetical protein